MSHDSEKLKRIVSFKQRLEKRVEELGSELKDLQATLEAVNSILLEQGFKHAKIVKSSSEVETLPQKEETAAETFQPSTEEEHCIPLTTGTGELLATLYVSGNSLQVVLAGDKNFNISTPPFTPFLVERVLVKMQEKDMELVKAGQITSEKMFSYNIIRDGDTVHEITIKNVGQDRLRELKSSIRWTLEKMYDKMKNPG